MPAVAAMLTWAVPSRAQDPAQNTTIVNPAPSVTPVAETTHSYTGPNRALIGTGLVTFGVSYIPAVVVASESGQQADHHLYVPVVGPWLDLGERPACGPTNVSCDTETTNKVLIAADGVFQGLGVVAVVAGFLSPEHEHVVVTTAKEAEAQLKPSIHLAPARLGDGGYGVQAFGKF